MVYITGDIHGSLDPVYKLFMRFSPAKDDIIVLLGDVSINYTGSLRDVECKHQLDRLGSTFFCIHGNHDNRPQNIASYHEKEWHGGRVMYEEAHPNILFPVDGDVFDIEGKQCLVIGGAYSVDRLDRLSRGMKWWPDEQPSPAIKEHTEEQIRNRHIDVIFSHTCPAKYIPVECLLSSIDQSAVDRSTELWLDRIEEAVGYKAWYLGHWHTDKRIDRIHFLYKSVETFDL